MGIVIIRVMVLVSRGRLVAASCATVSPRDGRARRHDNRFVTVRFCMFSLVDDRLTAVVSQRGIWRVMFCATFLKSDIIGLFASLNVYLYLMR